MAVILLLWLITIYLFYLRCKYLICKPCERVTTCSLRTTDWGHDDLLSPWAIGQGHFWYCSQDVESYTSNTDVVNFSSADIVRDHGIICVFPSISLWYSLNFTGERVFFFLTQIDYFLAGEATHIFSWSTQRIVQFILIYFRFLEFHEL